jgi:hypothetical protein
MITERLQNSIWDFKDEFGATYTEEGLVYGPSFKHPGDLIKEHE